MQRYQVTDLFYITLNILDRYKNRSRYIVYFKNFKEKNQYFTIKLAKTTH